jgi:hypothetical protein
LIRQQQEPVMPPKMPPNKKRVISGKPQPPSASVIAHSSPPTSPYSDGALNVVNDANQIASLISLCFPFCLQSEFVSFAVQRLYSLFSSIGKPSFCEIESIFSCLLSGYNDCRAAHPIILPHRLRLIACHQVDITKSLHDAFLIDCTLSRTTKKSRVKCESTFTDTVIRTRVSPSLAESANDHLFRTLILYFPYAGCFFTTARQLHTTPSGDSSSQFQFSPIPYSWLRLRYADGKPAKGSFISSIHRSWSMDWTTPNNPNICHCIQFSDLEDGAPLLAPDIIREQHFHDQKSARALFRQLLADSPSNKFGCRRYVKGSFHHSIPRTCLHYDVFLQGDMVFQITTHDHNSRPETQSHLSVCTLLNNSELKRALEVATNHFISDRAKFGKARHAGGDLGHMTAVGVLAARTGGSLFETKAGTLDTPFRQVLPDLCRLAAQFAHKQFPGLVPAIHHLESTAGITRPSYMGGEDGVSSSMVVSVDLANSTHYDVNDASMCFAIFAESKPYSTTGWYFTLPNVLVKFQNCTYHGLALKLNHGACVHWDGRIIRHGTSVHNRATSDDHTLGFFWAASSRAFDTSMNM